MKKTILYTAAFCLLAVACTKSETEVNVQAPQPVEIPSSAYDGELLIKFSPEMTDILDETDLSSGQATRSGIPSTDEVLAILGAYSFERVFPVDPSTEERSRKAGLHLWYSVKFDPEKDLAEAVASLSRLGEISSVQTNSEICRSYRTDVKPCVAGGTSVPAEGFFNDEYLQYQWGYVNKGNLPFEKKWAKTIAGADVGCEEAWKLCTGNPEIIVAVLDEGVMYNHPDLAANMWVNEDEEFFAGKDADGNGYKDDKYGYNFAMDTPIISVDANGNVGHGTHVAGTIAAVNDNHKGVCGIAGGGKGSKGVRIMSCQLFDGSRAASKAAAARAIKYAADNGAVILQCSWGYLSADSDPMYNPYPGPATEEDWQRMAPIEKDAIDYFVQNAGGPNEVMEGGIPIFASGNEYAAISSFPAAYSKCLSVSALAADYTPASYTNWGEEVDFSAPGGDNDYYGEPGAGREAEDIASAVNLQGSILSTIVSGGQPAYGFMEGTSMACPHVTGVAALGLSYAAECHRHFTAEEFIRLMKETARGLDDYYTHDKAYHFQSYLTGTRFVKMNLLKYRGKMGRIADAGNLLKAIGNGAGKDMILPNMYVKKGETVRVDLSRYFKPGSAGFRLSGFDASIVNAELEGTVLALTGKEEGFSGLTVTAGSEEQTATVTVRSDASDHGWM